MTNLTDCCHEPALPIKVVDEYDLRVVPTGHRTLLVCVTCICVMRARKEVDAVVKAGPNAERWYLA